MSFDLLITVKNYFNNNLVTIIAGYFRESETVVRYGLNAVIPVSLAGIVLKAESSPETLFNLAKEARRTGILNSFEKMFELGSNGVPTIGPSLIGNIFGEKFGKITNSISNFTGIKDATAFSLLGTILTLELGLIAEYADKNNLSSTALSSIIGFQKKSFFSVIPEGLNISGLLRGSATVYHISSIAVKKR